MKKVILDKKRKNLINSMIIRLVNFSIKIRVCFSIRFIYNAQASNCTHLFSNLHVPHAPNSARVNVYNCPVSFLPKVDHLINQCKRPIFR